MQVFYQERKGGKQNGKDFGQKLSDGEKKIMTELVYSFLMRVVLTQRRNWGVCIVWTFL